MTLPQILVTTTGLGLIAAIIWFFWLKHATGTRAAISSSGHQETTILVKDGVYTPDTILVDRDTPVRLTFRLEEATPCSAVGLTHSGQLTRSAWPAVRAARKRGSQTATALPDASQPSGPIAARRKASRRNGRGLADRGHGRRGDRPRGE